MLVHYQVQSLQNDRKYSKLFLIFPSTLAKSHIRAQKFLVVETGIALEDLSLFGYRLDNRALGRDGGVISYLQMTDDSHLAGEHAIVADFGRTGDAGLRTKHRMLPDFHIVSKRVIVQK